MTSGKILALTTLALGLMVSASAADVAGKWSAQIDTPIGLLNYTYEFKVDGAKLTGRAV